MKKVIDMNVDTEAVFKTRPNRYLAEVEIEIDGEIITELAHVHDPGRLKELLYEDNKVLLRKADNLNRKTKWDVIAAASSDGWILIHSAYHRKISEAILNDEEINPLGKMDLIKPEVKYKNSRIDYYVEKGETKTWIEVKGCSLAVDGVAIFPDAPTKRGRRHILELMELIDEGYEACLYILVLRESEIFKPNIETDPDFYKTFYDGIEKGIKVFPILLELKEDGVYYKKLIEIKNNN